MRVLFDQGVPAPLRKLLTTHQVSTTYELKWHQIKNGELLNRAESEGFNAFVTTDQNLKYQQNLKQRTIAIVVISTTSWPMIVKVVKSVSNAIDSATPGSYVEVLVPN